MFTIKKGSDFIKNNFRIKRFAKNKAYLDTKFGIAQIDKKEVIDRRQGDFVEAFLYYDNNDILRASKDFKLKLDTIYSLKASEITKNGVFFSTEDGKKLFMPFAERTYRINKEMTYPVILRSDEYGMIFLSSKIRDSLSNEHNFSENDEVTGRIYSINKTIGAFVAIDNKYDSLLRVDEINGVITEGELVTARVKEVKNDGKIELTLRKRAYEEIDEDSKMILEYLHKNHGVLNLGDKSSPQQISKEFNISKASFKRAIGRLYKNNRITISDYKINLRRDNDRRQ